VIGEVRLDWSEIYERLARRPDRPDPQAMEALEQRVRAWATVRAAGLSRDAADDVTADTCAEVWRQINLSRGGAAFEGFVQGRFVEAVRVLHARAEAGTREATGAQEVTGAMNAGAASSAPTVGALLAAPDETPARHDQPEARAERLRACLEELRARNPRHHRAIELIYVDQATPREAADALVVDLWTLRLLIARARLALAQSLDRAERRQAPGSSRRAAPRPGAKPGRPGGKSPGGKPSGGKPGRHRKGRPPTGGRPR
jgi:DNA-directed RNA polymerase specialized sigma24 family protein